MTLYNPFDSILRQQRALQDLLERILRPNREIQESIDSLLHPYSAFQKQIDLLLEPSRQLQEQVSRFLNTQALAGTTLHAQLEIDNSLHTTIDSVTNATSHTTGHVTKILELHRKAQEQAASYLQLYDSLESGIAKILEPQRFLQQQVDQYIETFLGYLQESTAKQLTIRDDGTIAFGDEVVDIDEIAHRFEEVAGLHQATTDYLKHLVESLSKMSAHARALIVRILVPLLLAIVANWSGPLYMDWGRELQTKERGSARKEIVERASALFSPDDLKDYRFVTARVLHVRDAASIEGTIIDELHLGRTVKVVKRANRWTYVEYRKEDSDGICQGWVFARYLEKFE